MPRKATSLEDFGEEKEKFVLSKEEIKEIVESFQEKFGGFGRKYINLFYEKAGIANITWKQRKIDGSEEPLPLGKILSINEFPEQNGATAWKKHKYTSDFPYLFWEECYRQIGNYISKKEYAEKMKLLELDKIAK